MKIAHIESSMNWGGQELRIVEQAEWLNNNGHTCWIIARPGAEIIEKAREKKVPVYELKIRGSLNPVTFMKLRKFLLMNSIELLDCHGSRDATYGALIKWFTSIAVVRSRHVTDLLRLDFFQRFLWRNGQHHVIVTASKIRDMLVNDRLVSSEHVYVAVAGVDEARFHPDINGDRLKEKLGIPLHHKVIANVCMIRPDKGVHYFAEASGALIKKYDSVTCVQIGDATAQTKRYKEKIVESLSPEIETGRFKFLGYQRDIENWLAICDVIVIASVATEAQTRLVSQAFLMKKNIIATTTGGLPEMINHKVTGLLCEPANAGEIVDFVESLIHDEPFCQRLQEEAYLHASKNMTFNKMMSGMLNTYGNLLSNGK